MKQIVLCTFAFACLYASASGQTTQAPCSEFQVEGFKPLIQLAQTFPKSNLSALIAIQIIEEFPKGLIAPPEIILAFDGLALLFAEIFNVSQQVRNVSNLGPAQLVVACATYNALNATSLSPLITFPNLLGLISYVEFGVQNELNPEAHVSNFSAGYFEHNTPAAIRLALIPHGMVVSWQTYKAYATQHPPTVWYGTHKRSLSDLSKGSSHTYGTVYFHDVKLEDLAYDTLYYYTIAGDVTHTIYNFTIAPEKGPTVVTLLGDMGYMNAEDTYNALWSLSNKADSNKVDLFIHIGDLSYADNYFLRPGFSEWDTYEESWNIWQNWLSPITQHVPYMVLPGNHEAACQELLTYLLCPPNQQNFTAYRHRFRMPSQESGAGEVENMWSSFDQGLVHYVMLNTETDFPGSPEGNGTISASGPFGGGRNSEQLVWLEHDLQAANANRHHIPWIIVLGHRPIYTGTIAEAALVDSENIAVGTVFAPILTKHHVDIYFAGHLHLYERMYPISNGVPHPYSGNVYTNPTAPTYIINGAAGNDEQLAAVTHNSTWGPYFNNIDYGFGKLHVHNSTHIQWLYIRAATGVVDDELWIVQKHRYTTTNNNN